MGSVCLEHTLKTPIKNAEKLVARQNIVKILCSKKNAELITKIHEHIKLIKNVEKQVLWFWEPPTEETQSLYEIVYFNAKYGDKLLNETDEVLACASFYTLFVSPVTTAAGPVLTALAPIVALKLFGVATTTGSSGSSANFLWTLLKTVFRIDVLKSLPPKALLTTLLGMLLWAAFYLYSVYSAISNSINTHKIINKLHEKIRAVSQFSENVEQIYALTSSKQLDLPLGDHSVERALLNSRRLFENYRGTVSNPSGLFNNKGVILRTYRQFMNIKDMITPLFAFIATIDCYISNARLSSEYGYCYPEYNSSKTQKIKNLWHPSFNGKTATKNTVELTNMLITGPNAAGKSTFIKSVALAVLTAQTLGLAPAAKMIFTPFDNIYSYLRIPDCKGRESLFEAEMHRCKEYLDLLGSSRSFIVIDEIFSSTNYKEGLSAAYAVCKKMAEDPNNTALITTHYTPLSKLEQDTQNKIINYKFNADINPDTQEIKYTYKIERGVSEQYIALKILKNEGYNQDIIADALEIYERVRLVITEKNISTD